MKYLVQVIGCLECGVPSYPLAIVETLEDAEAVKDFYPGTWVMHGGDGYVEIIELSKVLNFQEGIVNMLKETDYKVAGQKASLKHFEGAALEYAQEKIDDLVKAQKEQEAKLHTDLFKKLIV